MTALVIKRCSAEDWAELAMELPQWAMMYEHVFAPGAVCWSGRTPDGVLLGAAGLIFTAPQHAYCWGAFLAERWPKVPGTILKLLKTRLAQLIAEKQLLRLEAKADCAHIAGCRLLEALGFRCEGLTLASNQYGEDQFLYARVTDEALQRRRQLLLSRYGDLTEQALTMRVRYVTESLESR